MESHRRIKGLIFVVICTLMSSFVFGLPHGISSDKAQNDEGKDDGTNETESRAVKAAGDSNNPLTGFQQMLAGNSSMGNMILGTYQALIMPMPRGQDLANGITSGLQMAQIIQNLFQG